MSLLSSGDPLLPAGPDEDAFAFPLSFAQQRLWFLDQLAPGHPVYNMPAAVRLEGALDIGVLESSVNALIQRHEILRTTITIHDEQPVQVIAPTLHVALPVEDLQTFAADEQDRVVQQRMRHEAARPFDLRQGPLLRMQILRLAPERHLLLLTMHHIVADGWSMGIFVRELAALYPAIRAGVPATLPELPIQYVDYALWQREWFAQRAPGDTLDEQLAYWRRQLHDAPMSLELPTDYPRPPAQSFRGALYQFNLPASLIAQLEQLSQRANATLFMTLLSAWYVVLYRYTGQTDLIVGTPIAGRTQVETEDLIGLFVNTLVLRADLAGRPSFLELLARVRAISLDAYAHQDLPFEKLIDELQPRRHSSRPPYVQVLFAHQNAPMPPLSFANITLSPTRVESGTAKFDLTLSLEPGEHGLQGSVEYMTDLFKPATIARMMQHLATLLSAVVADPTQPIDTLPLLSPSEREHQIVTWNQSHAPYPQDLGIHQLFESQAACTPETIALIGEAEQLSYAELNRRANQLARYLQAQGVGRAPESLVGLLVERSAAMVIAVLAVLKAGGAYVPLDPTLPPERLHVMIDDARLALVLSQGEIATRLGPIDDAQQNLTIVALDTEWPQIAGHDTHNLDLHIEPQQLAYVMYTSGSTGVPKGVAVAHASVVNFLRWMQQTYPLAADDRVLHTVPLGFDISVREIFWPLCSGAQLVLARPGSQADLPYLLAAIQRWGITQLRLVPPLLRLMLQEPDLAACSTLRRVFSGGEPLPPALPPRFFEQLSAELHTTYGPTETTVNASAYACTPNPAHVIPLGDPVANTQLYVLDSRLEPVPLGVVGELCIAGAALARGYLAQPHLTAERFVPNPFSQKPGSRLYRTGDLVRRDADGVLEFVGRDDDQIKLRGLRIELGEIESVLRQHVAVRDAVVVLRADPEPRLVAYVVENEESRTGRPLDDLEPNGKQRNKGTKEQSTAPFPSPVATGEGMAKPGVRASEGLPSSLRAHLSQRLPDYMIPSVIVPLDALPLTSSGKLDRKALPVPDAPESHADYVEPQTPTEIALAAIWAEVLHVERVSRHAHFFEQGGHSLLATQLTMRVRKVFQIDMPLQAVFDRPTLAELAEHIQQMQQQAAGLDDLPLLPTPRVSNLPLSFAQERLWFLDRLEPGNTLYNMSVAFHLTGVLDVTALERSFNAIVARHEVLRTTFGLVEDRPVQVIAPALHVPLSVVDLTGLTPAAQAAEAQRLAAEHAAYRFDLTTGPLLHLTLVDLGPTEHYVLVTMHHIVADGWSTAILIRELRTWYAAALARSSRLESAALDNLPIQYADYAVWQRQRLAPGALLDQLLGYWRNQLHGAPGVLDLPTDRPRPAVQSYQGAAYRFSLPVELSQQLTQMGKVERQPASLDQPTTLFMTLLAAWYTLLWRYTGQADLVVGAPIANRTRVEIEDLIGCFFNTLVLRAQLDDQISFRQLVQQVRATTLAAYEHQELPFEKLVEALAPVRSLSTTPLFQVVFALNFAEEPIELAELTVRPVEVDLPTSRFDLMLLMRESAAGLSGSVEYNADLFDATTIERLMRHYQSVLEYVVAHPEQPLSRIPLLSADERDQIVEQWNATQAHFGDAPCLSVLIAAQAARTPDRIAARCGDRELTYAALYAHALELAHQLRAQGIGAETVVAVLAERDLPLLVAIVAISIAGGAYLPLDPRHPPKRHQQILAASGTPLVLTSPELAPSLAITFADWPGANPPQVYQLDPALSALPDVTEWLNPVTPETLAYVIYTSGSTGQPKGVMIEQAGLLNHLYAMIAQLAMTRDDVMAQTASQCFDISVWQLLTPLIIGGCVDILPDAVAHDPAALLRAVEQHRITILEPVPSLLSAMLDLLEQRAISQPDFAHVRWVIPTGEALPPALSRRWFQQYPSIPLVNAYGPAECSDDVTLHVIREALDEAQTVVPIGRPIDNLRVHVLDPNLEPVPIGVAGELYVGGIGVGRGYLSDPGLTASAFLPDPFSREQPQGTQTGPGARIYRTGDIGRYQPDGTIEYLGRRDHQVKVRGYRIELGEIEAALQRHPAVREAVVVARELAPGDARLVAYVTENQEPRTKNQEPRTKNQEPRTKNLREQGNKEQRTKEQRSTADLPSPAATEVEADRGAGQGMAKPGVRATSEGLSSSQLRSFLGAQLPEYMVPSAIVVLDALPLTPNGKVDRKALPLPTLTPQAREQVAPRTPEEQWVAALYEQLLGVANISVYDNFFELGGHSLLATQVISRVRAAFNIELPLRTMFQAPVVADFARQVAQATGAAGLSTTLPLVPVPRDGALVLSFSQQRLWFLEEWTQGSGAYHIRVGIRLRGHLDRGALAKAVALLVQRHESLRTIFPLVDNQPAQVILADMPVPIADEDLQGWPEPERLAEAQRRLAELVQQPFDLATGPLLRMSLLQLAPQEQILLVVLHHIIADAWSLQVLVDDLSRLYAAIVTAQPADLPRLPIQYADYAVWQRQHFQGELLEQQLGYWRNQLQSAPRALNLPTDHPRPQVQTYRGDGLSFRVPATLVADLTTLAQREGATLFMTLLAAWYTLLWRYTGQADLVVGAPIANRTRVEIEGLIGCFINTLVLRTQLAGQMRFTELMQQVRATTLDAYAHQELPFDVLVNALELERNLSTSPLFQVLFNLHDMPERELQVADLTMTPIDVPRPGAKFDLNLEFALNEAGLWGYLEYNGDLFEPATAARMVEHLSTLLAGIVAEPHAPLRDLPLLTAAEQAELLIDRNATGVSYPREMCLHELFETQARRTPAAVAVRCEGQKLTYAELDARSNQLAHHLRSLGVEMETLVAICMDRSLDLVVGLLGILKAGGAYVPLDPGYPQDRLQFILEDAQAPVLITQQHLQLRLPTGGAAVVCLDTDWTQIAGNPSTHPARGAESTNLAYVIYTSGSTGQPKGAMNIHAAIVNRLLWMQDQYQLDADDRVLQKTPFSFDVSVWEFFWPLLAGATLVVAKPEGHKDPAYLIDLIDREQITTLHFVPSMLQVFLNERDVERCASLRRVICSGEALPLALQERFFARIDAELHNLYGPTEAAVDVTFWRCQPNPALHSVPIGRPVANTQIYLLDPELNPVPTGVAGELYIGGVQLARGYHSRPTLTAEKFIPDPFASEHGARLYRTGDLARYLLDGAIEYLGRLDDQVKVRGFRIELGEIEVVLGQYPAVQEAIVVAREDTPGERRLVAYVVGEQKNKVPGAMPRGRPAHKEPKNKEQSTGNLPSPIAIGEGPGVRAGGEGLTRSLREFLAQRLPEYMVPAVFVELERLPLSPNGKVDRKALPAPSHKRAELPSQYTAPRTETEALLAQIWARELKLDRVGVTDNFFELGGDSILSIQIVARARQQGLDLSPRLLFLHQSIAELALHAQPLSAIDVMLPAITGPVPLTPIQHEFFAQQLPNPQHYNQALLLAVPQPLDPAALDQALQALVAHHDALRLRFTLTASGWQQQVAPPTETPLLDVVDLSAVPADQHAAVMQQHFQAAQTGLDLAHGPLLRAVLVPATLAQDTRLLLVAHHLVVDGVSWRILLADLHTVYQQIQASQPVQLGAVATPFGAWAQQLHAYAQQNALRADAAFWLRRPAHAPTLPLDQPGGANTVGSTQRLTRTLPVADTQALLQTVPAVYHTQINDVLLTALVQAVAPWAGATGLLVDLEGHGREPLDRVLDVTRTVGWFTTYAPLWLDLDGDTAPGAALKQIKEQLRQVPQRGLSYGLLRYLREDADLQATLAALPRPQLSFNYLGQWHAPGDDTAAWSLVDEPHGPIQDPAGTRSHVLVVSAAVVDGALQVQWSYSDQLHEATTIAALADAYQQALAALIAHCLSPDAGGFTPSDFPDMEFTQAELDDLISDLDFPVED